MHPTEIFVHLIILNIPKNTGKVFKNKVMLKNIISMTFEYKICVRQLKNYHAIRIHA
jgi:hypothetical protein